MNRRSSASASRRASSRSGLLTSQRTIHVKRASQRKRAATRKGQSDTSPAVVGRAVSRTPPIDSSDNVDGADMESDLVSKKFARGFRPSFNDKPIVITDPHNKKVYFVGGAMPTDEDASATSDLFCCETDSMSWKDLTPSLTFWHTPSLFSKKEMKPLPRLEQPGCTLFRIEGNSFLLLFGGYDSEREQATSRLIFVDLTSLFWWEATTEGGAVVARINPAITAIGNKLYVFGGHRKFRSTNPGNCLSYSVATFDLDGEVWTWEVRDKAYPTLVASVVFGQATPILEGAQILLTPGTSNEDTNLDFTKDNIFTFNTKKMDFRNECIGGEPPLDVGCYQCFPQPDLPPGVASVLIFAWVTLENGVDESDLIPDLWRLNFAPDYEMRPLGYRERICSVDEELDDEGRSLDLREVFIVGKRFVLAGYQPDVGVRYDGLDDLDGAVYNTYVEIPIPTADI